MKTITTIPCCQEEQLQKRNLILDFLQWISTQKIEGAEYLSRLK